MITIRPRRDADLSELGRHLLEQQATSGYPHRHPPTTPAADFVARPGALAALTAELDGQPVGHLAILPVRDPGESNEPELARLWIAGHGLPADRLGEVGVYFTARHVRGQGVGAALMRAGLDTLTGLGLAPCLDVVPIGTAVDLYRRTGWQEVGRARPSWLEADAPDVVVMVLPRGRPAGRLSA